VPATIEPEPSETEREAILAALALDGERAAGAWVEAALHEGVEGGDPDP
jgi:hypothetical protein